MNDDSFTSGFMKSDAPFTTSSFTDIREIYRSHSGSNILYSCQRYGKLHVLKTLLPSYRGTVFYEQALEKEFNIGYQLEHPHICRTIGWELVDSLGACILMEYVDGLTLKDFMEQGKLTPQMATKIIAELCDALQYIHNKQIIHRDLKPSNVLITYNGCNVKLIDFSLSDCDDYQILKSPAGTRYYLAPEALETGCELDLRADIYSLGVIIGEMAASLNDRKLAAISRKCTRRKREQRYSSAAEVKRVLFTTRQIGGYVAGGVALLLLTLGAVFYGLPTFTPDQPVSYPVYGNRVCSDACTHVLAAERLRLLQSAASADRGQFQQDSLQLVHRLKQTLDVEFPLAELRQTPLYRQQWKVLQEEANRVLKEVKHAYQP